MNLILRQAFSLSRLGRLGEVGELLEAHRELCEKLRDASLTGEYLCLLGRNYVMLGQPDRARECAELALQESHDNALLGRAYYILTVLGAFAGQPIDGIEAGVEAAKLLRSAKEDAWLGMLFWIRGVDYFYAGLISEALADEEAAVAIENRRSQSYGLYTGGVIKATMGNAEEGVSDCRRGLAYAPDPYNAADASGRLGEAYLETGQFDQAIPLLKEAAGAMEEFQHGPNHAAFTTLLGEAYLKGAKRARGRHAERDLSYALDELEYGLARSEAIGFAWGVGRASRALGRYHQVKGADEEAKRCLQRSLLVFNSNGMIFEEGRTHLALAEFAQTHGEQTDMERELQAARQRFAQVDPDRRYHRYSYNIENLLRDSAY